MLRRLYSCLHRYPFRDILLLVHHCNAYQFICVLVLQYGCLEILCLLHAYKETTIPEYIPVYEPRCLPAYFMIALLHCRFHCSMHAYLHLCLPASPKAYPRDYLQT